MDEVKNLFELFSTPLKDLLQEREAKRLATFSPLLTKVFKAHEFTLAPKVCVVGSP